MLTRLRSVKTLVGSAFLLLVLLQVEGCYYMQAIRGHTDLMSRRRPVPEVIEDASVPGDIRERLLLVAEARDFAVSQLLLPDNDSYRTYADLERDFVVWNVFAAPEFSLTPKTWCFPVAGCVAYRGYFSESAARKLGDRLQADGYDIAIGGVSAYSTLGRFADPVLNTMMRWPDLELVSTLFHELAHQKLYIKGDSAFNESFASAVAEIGLARWLDATNATAELAAYRARRNLREQVLVEVSRTRERLEALYRSALDDDAMRAGKREILDALSARAGQILTQAGSNGGNWLAAPLNNARLVSLNLYEGRVDAFRVLYADCGESISCFYAQAESLAELSTAERNRRLDDLAASP
jgi:predicted aminopeptidase